MFDSSGRFSTLLVVLVSFFQPGSVHVNESRTRKNFRYNAVTAPKDVHSLYQPSQWKGRDVATVDSGDDPIFNELLYNVPHLPGSSNYSAVGWLPSYILTDLSHVRKRAAWDMARMMKCATGCNPLIYKGYGCYCGFLGSGQTVDGIDICCKMHDWCYTRTSCMLLSYHLPYFVPYKWKCNGGAPYCITGKRRGTEKDSCSHHLCECDREFATCLGQFSCPRTKAMCRSPWRYWQNLFMGLGTGQSMHDPHHKHARGKYRSRQPVHLVKHYRPPGLP